MIQTGHTATNTTSEIHQWLEEHDIDFQWTVPNSVFEVNNGPKFCVAEGPSNGDNLISPFLSLNVSEQCYDTAEANRCDYFVFEFGGKFYYTPIAETAHIRLNDLLYIGTVKSSIPPLPALGIHDYYEILNGTRSPKDWVRKMKFVGTKVVAQCNRNSLGGALAFQLTCSEAKINNLTAMEIETTFGVVKLYVSTSAGWKNLVRISNHINVELIPNGQSPVVDWQYLINHSDGLVCVLRYDFQFSDKIVFDLKSSRFVDTFTQVDFVQWTDQQFDIDHCANLERYFVKWAKFLPPVLISDAYYLEREDAATRRKLRSVGGSGLEPGSDDRFFKTADQIVTQFNHLFRDFADDRKSRVWSAITSNIDKLIAHCGDFKIDTKTLHLPQYTPLDGSTADEFFDRLVQKGWQQRLSWINDDDTRAKYQQRLDHEVSIIREGGFVSYFLIVWDIYQFCYDNEILVGYGRGSCAASLLAYLLYIHHVDPIEYNLLFSRFLNKGRMLGSLPDIDSDVCSSDREKVRDYLRERFGRRHVCNIGTYQTLQLKAALKDFARHSSLRGSHANEVNLMTSIITDDTDEWSSVNDFELLFINASRERKLKQFIQDNPLYINQVKTALGSPKTYGIHAAGMLVIPDKDKNGNPMDLFDTLPVRALEDGTLVTTWEYPYCEKAGFLKEDLLSIQHLDKVKMIRRLVREGGEEFPDIYNIKPVDGEVLDLFEKGYAQDTFHFGSDGLSHFVKIGKPSNIHDLIAMIALFRPGPMESGLHMKWLDVKNGKSQPEYDWGCEPFTKNTYGILTLQEQVIHIVSYMANLDEVMADNVRRAMGKKIKEEMDKYETLFVQGAVEKGCDEGTAIQLWHKIVAFSGYCFNAGHSTSYAMNGYVSQYLKRYYPLEFWTTALHFARDNEDIVKFAREMREVNPNITMSTVDINNSRSGFSFDKSSHRIFWGFERVSHVGDGAANEIVSQREAGGKFFSLDEFVVRVQYKGSPVNSRAVRNLILCGAFDEIENMTDDPLKRVALIRKYYADLKKQKQLDAAEAKEPLPNSSWAAILLQKQMCGFGDISFQSIIEAQPQFKSIVNTYLPASRISNKSSVGKKIVYAGLIQSVVQRNTKNGAMGVVTLAENVDIVRVVIWPDQWDALKTLITKSLEGKNLLIVSNCEIKYDEYNSTNGLYATKSTQVLVV